MVHVLPMVDHVLLNGHAYLHDCLVYEHHGQPLTNLHGQPQSMSMVKDHGQPSSEHPWSTMVDPGIL